MLNLCSSKFQKQISRSFNFSVFNMTSLRLLLGLLLLFISGCSAIYNGVFKLDDTSHFEAIQRHYYLPIPDGQDHFLLTQGVGGAFSHKTTQTWAFDFSMPVGTPVYAARKGQILSVRSKSIDPNKPRHTQPANYVRILHPDGEISNYIHIDSALVFEGAYVIPGDTIALSGNTGYSTHPHLHFHVSREGLSIPAAFIDVDDPNGIPRAGRIYKGSRTTFNTRKNRTATSY